MSKKISSLPLAKSLPSFLTPDAATPDVHSLLHLSDFKTGQTSLPSNLRRSRQVRGGAHFSYVTPLPTRFPYELREDDLPEPEPRKVSGQAVGDGTEATEAAAEQERTAKDEGPKQISVEDFLARLEPSLQHPVLSTSKLFTSPARKRQVGQAELVALSPSCIADILPDLDAKSEEGRAELTQMLSGHAVFSDEAAGFAPWSLCYGGHQFGSWAGQLGDGRAISILTTPSPAMKDSASAYYPAVAELQLKGAGRTPFSRFADGLAVLRSSVREFLGSEAVAALGIPTSRALSLIHLPDIPVARETRETGAVVCRIAPSWLRIGNFEIQHDRQEWDSLLRLTSYASTQLFGLEKTSAIDVLRQVSERNARTFAAWQAYGFCHGVLNTDNISCLGLTIDYGPYAFMDIFDPSHVCNHSDDFGRYSYKMQPTMGAFAVGKLGDALSELLGAEEEGKGGVQEGWAKQADNAQLNRWRKRGLEIVGEVKQDFTKILVEEYRRLMRQRLGITEGKEDDFAKVFDPLLDLMTDHRLDYSRTLRTLCDFDGSNADATLDALQLGGSKRKEWQAWLQVYSSRVGASPAERKRSNPRFVLRQWVLEEAIKRCVKEPEFLQKVLEMSVAPFENYADGEEARLCGMGEEKLLGMQCSCSS